MPSARPACAGLPTSLFFPEKNQRAQLQRALTICHACPVRALCLDAALKRGEVHGVWGGISERARRQLRPDQRASWHGTAAGYRARGCRCSACSIAHAEAQAAWVERRVAIPHADHLEAGVAIPHGTLGGYTNHRCRCLLCRGAKRDAARAYRQTRAA